MTNTVRSPQQLQSQGPNTHHAKTGTPSQKSPSAHGNRQNRIAIWALVAAISGSILAVWQGAHPAGWFLLPVAFVLSLVALFRKGAPKKMAVAALIISVVGAVIGALAFTSSVVTGIDEDINTETTISEPAEAEAEDVVAGAPGEKGTRENPVPLGTTVSSDEWEVTVDSFTTDATDVVMTEDESNVGPAEGEVYALISLSVKRVSADPAYPTEIDVSYVAEDGNVVSSFEAMVVVPDDLSSANELSEGAEASGNVAVMIPEGDAGTILITPGRFADDVFFTTS